MASHKYAHPEALVSADWVQEHLDDPAIRIIESNEDVLLYGIGHMPGARSVPWKTAANDDRTFKSADELHRIYADGLGLKRNGDTIVYCRIGERWSHTWFVLTYLPGFNKVRN